MNHKSKAKGLILSIEGTDGCGKETQSRELEKRLKKRGYAVRRISFPRYDDESSILLRRYLGGSYGDHPEDVNAYTASTFYAVDRADAFLGELGDFYRDGGILITDRYTTSNLIHQASKIDDLKEREDFIAWLEDFEYGKLGIPRPDLVFFLDLPSVVSDHLIEHRAEAEGEKKDIHEADAAYLKKSRERALGLIERCGWTHMDCMGEKGIRPIGEIADELESESLKLLESRDV